jgi:hypothetical protein
MKFRSFSLVLCCLFVLNAAVAADDPKPYTATGKPEDRDYWTKDADQHWEKVADGKWVEITKDKKYNWVEKDNTKQYIEMSDASRNLTIRLSDDSCTWVRDIGGGKTQLQRLYGGKWGKTDVTAKPPDTSKSPPPDSSKSPPAKAYTATGKPEDRDYWTRDADQHWEKVAEGKWVEITKDAKYDWVEKKNTNQFIEMEDASRNLTIRLSDGACTWVRGPGKLERLYPGKWGKTDVTAKPPDTSKSPPPDSSKSPPVKSYTATGKPEDRDYWTKDAEQHFEKVGEGKWLEIAKEGKHDWVEKQNTKQFIELNDASRNLTIRLSDDACTWVLGGGAFKPLYPGKWGKTDITTKPPDDPKPVARAKAQWVDSVDKMKFPEGMVAGKLNGLDFEPSEVTYNSMERELKFSWKKDNKTILPDLEISLDLPNVGNKAAPIKKGQIPENVTLKKNFKQNVTDYQLRIVPQDRTPNNKTDNGVLAVNEWAYIIEYTGKQGDKLVGKIYMCSSGDKKHFLAGSFEATIVK